MGACRRSPTSPETSPACPGPTWSGCTPWCRTGSSSPTCRSPTSSCGCRSARPRTRSTPAGSRWRRCGRRPGRPRPPTTWWAPRSRRGTGRCSTRRGVERRIHRESDPDWTSGVPVRAEAIPVTRDGRVIAVIERSTNLNGARTPSRLELTYLAGGRRPGPDDLRGYVPLPGPRHHAGALAAGRRRHAPAGRRGPGDLRQPERAVRLPQARAHGRPDGHRAGQRDRAAGGHRGARRRVR